MSNVCPQASVLSPRVISGLGDQIPAPTAGTGGPAAHPLPQIKLDPRTYDRALDCVHCGLCLPACPTYTQNGLEGDSPRGRIMLMKGLADGQIEPTASVIEHLDLCLDCRACETACPSGVVYHELIEETREKLLPLKKKTAVDSVLDAVFFNVFPYTTRLKLSLVGPRVLQKLGLWNAFTAVTGKLLPRQLRKMQQMLPTNGPVWEKPLLTRYPSTQAQPAKATVGFFAGCIGSVLFQKVNRQSVALLQHAGCDVVVPGSQGCCGAIHHHGGRTHDAAAMARANIDAFLPRGEPGVAMIVANVAGCGAMLKDYAHLLRDDPAYAERAREFVARVRDISEALLTYELPQPTHEVKQTVTYHDACHLLHAQKVSEPPRALLARVPGLTLMPLPESDICCGAAGTYNLSQPEMATQLAERKLGNIGKTGANVCVTGNVGCAMQIQSESDRLGRQVKVVHPVSVLYEACFGPGAPDA